MLRVFYGVNLDDADCQNFIIVLIAPVLNHVNYFFEGRLSSLVKLFLFAGLADRLPMISFAAFSTQCTVGWTFVPRVLFSAVVAGFPFLFPMNGIYTSILLMAFTTSCQCLPMFTCRLVASCSLNSGCKGQ